MSVETEFKHVVHLTVERRARLRLQPPIVALTVLRVATRALTPYGASISCQHGDKDHHVVLSAGPIIALLEGVPPQPTAYEHLCHDGLLS